jgi:GntR family transcriptional regulator
MMGAGKALLRGSMAAGNSRIPKWYGTRTALLELIDSNGWSSGGKLPSEPELALKLGVSRATLREALRSLHHDGYLERRPGVGTRVVKRALLENSLDNNFGVADVIRSMGRVPGTRSLEIRLSSATEDVARDLAIDIGSDVAIIERIRTADGQPVVFSRHFYPSRGSGEGATALAGLEGESLYTLLETRAGIQVHYGTAVIEPVVADDELAARLDVKPGSLLMHFWQVDYDQQHVPVMLSSEFFRSDSFQFTIFRRGPRSDSPISPGPTSRQL